MAENFVGLIIMDGYGLGNPKEDNAVYLAKKPNLDYLFNKYPNNTLKADGEVVGLPDGQMGNSEVGHLNLGAGRVVYQSLTRINVAIKDNSFFNNEAFLQAINHVKQNNSKLHILGLTSDGGVHSHLNHIIALNNLAIKHGLENKVYLHAFTDGRDTSQKGGYDYVKTLLDNGVNIATVAGRYYAMDRDNNWERLQLAYDNLTLGVGKHYNSALEGIESSYNNDITDEFIVPFVVDEKGLIEDNDAVIFANFRPDRAIRIATALSNPEDTSKYVTEGKPQFKLDHVLTNLFFVSMMHYNESVKGLIAFPLQTLNNLYGEVISKNGLRQLRIAETEKYAHVTFFFDGGKETDLKNSDRILVESPQVETYDLKPEMSAYEVKDRAVEAIKSKKYQTMILNFANPDMVGHTGSIPATIKAVETIDTCVGEVVEAIKSIGGVAIIIADHGNAEQMRDSEGNLHTAHTNNLVPIIITKEGIKISSGGALCDVAPTMLDLLGIDKPVEMTGKSLIIK